MLCDTNDVSEKGDPKSSETLHAADMESAVTVKRSESLSPSRRASSSRLGSGRTEPSAVSLTVKSLPEAEQPETVLEAVSDKPLGVQPPGVERRSRYPPAGLEARRRGGVQFSNGRRYHNGEDRREGHPGGPPPPGRERSPHRRFPPHSTGGGMYADREMRRPHGRLSADDSSFSTSAGFPPRRGSGGHYSLGVSAREAASAGSGMYLEESRMAEISTLETHRLQPYGGRSFQQHAWPGRRSFESHNLVGGGPSNFYGGVGTLRGSGSMEESSALFSNGQDPRFFMPVAPGRVSHKVPVGYGSRDAGPSGGFRMTGDATMNSANALPPHVGRFESTADFAYRAAPPVMATGRPRLRLIPGGGRPYQRPYAGGMRDGFVASQRASLSSDTDRAHLIKHNGPSGAVAFGPPPALPDSGVVSRDSVVALLIWLAESGRHSQEALKTVASWLCKPVVFQKNATSIVKLHTAAAEDAMSCVFSSTFQISALQQQSEAGINVTVISAGVVEVAGQLLSRSALLAGLVAMWAFGEGQFPVDTLTEDDFSAFCAPDSPGDISFEAGKESEAVTDGVGAPASSEEDVKDGSLRRYWSVQVLIRAVLTSAMRGLEGHLMEGRMVEARNLLCFIFDLASLKVIPSCEAFRVIAQLLELAQELEQQLDAFSCALSVLNVLLNALPWLAQSSCEECPEDWNACFQLLEKLVDQKREPLMWTGATLQPVHDTGVAQDSLALGIASLRSLQQQPVWVSKALPRVYFSAAVESAAATRPVAGSAPGDPPTLGSLEVDPTRVKMAFLRNHVAHLEIGLAGFSPRIDVNVAAIGPLSKTEEGSYTYDIAALRDFGVAGDTLGQNGSWDIRFHLTLWDTEELTALLKGVRPLDVHDRWVLVQQFISVLHGFRHRVALCAEALLRIPFTHDEFEIVLVETIFTELLKLPYACEAPVFYARLLLILTQRQASLLPLVQSALKKLVLLSPSWDARTFETLAHFFAFWFSSCSEEQWNAFDGFSYWGPAAIRQNWALWTRWGHHLEDLDEIGAAAAAKSQSLGRSDAVVVNLEDQDEEGGVATQGVLIDAVQSQRLPRDLKQFLRRAITLLALLVWPESLRRRLPGWLAVYVPSQDAEKQQGQPVVCRYAKTFGETASYSSVVSNSLPRFTEYALFRKLLLNRFSSPTHQKEHVHGILTLLLKLIGRPGLAELPSEQFIQQLIAAGGQHCSSTGGVRVARTWASASGPDRHLQSVYVCAEVSGRSVEPDSSRQQIPPVSGHVPEEVPDKTLVKAELSGNLCEEKGADADDDLMDSHGAGEDPEDGEEPMPVVQSFIKSEQEAADMEDVDDHTIGDTLINEGAGVVTVVKGGDDDHEDEDAEDATALDRRGDTPEVLKPSDVSLAVEATISAFLDHVAYLSEEKCENTAQKQQMVDVVWNCSELASCFVRAMLAHGSKTLTHLGRVLTTYGELLRQLRPTALQAHVAGGGVDAGFVKQGEDGEHLDHHQDTESESKENERRRLAAVVLEERDDAYFASILRVILSFWQTSHLTWQRYVLTYLTRQSIVPVTEVQNFMYQHLSMKLLVAPAVQDILLHVVLRHVAQSFLSGIKEAKRKRRMALGGPLASTASRSDTEEALILRNDVAQAVTHHVVALCQRIAHLNGDGGETGADIGHSSTCFMEDQCIDLIDPYNVVEHERFQEVPKTEDATTEHPLISLRVTHTPKQLEIMCLRQLLDHGRMFVLYVDLQHVRSQLTPLLENNPKIAELIQSLEAVQSLLLSQDGLECERQLSHHESGLTLPLTKTECIGVSQPLED